MPRKAPKSLDLATLCGPDPYGEVAAQRARASGNAAPLVRYLRRAARAGAHIGPELAGLLADVLEGKARVTVKLESGADALRGLLPAAVELLAAGDADVCKRARELGYTPEQIAHGNTRKRIARHIVADAYGLTLRALDDRLTPRPGRLKRG